MFPLVISKMNQHRILELLCWEHLVSSNLTKILKRLFHSWQRLLFNFYPIGCFCFNFACLDLLQSFICSKIEFITSPVLYQNNLLTQKLNIFSIFRFTKSPANKLQQEKLLLTHLRRCMDNRKLMMFLDQILNMMTWEG